MLVISHRQTVTSGKFVENLANLATGIWSGNHSSISPNNFRKLVGEFKEEFGGNKQQDAHEFLTFLVDWLHIELKTIKQVSDIIMIQPCSWI